MPALGGRGPGKDVCGIPPTRRLKDMSSSSPDESSATPRADLTAETDDSRSLEIAIRDARQHLEADVLAWNADLTAAITALDHSQQTQQLSEARERLERLEQTLRRAPGQMAEHLRRQTARLASAAASRQRRLRQHEAAAKQLASANEQLHQEISARARVEREAKRVERGLREVRERFESAFNNAPIGMALIDMNERWLQVNDALCGIVGHTREELKATTLRAMTHPEDVDLDADSLEQLVSGVVSNCQAEKRYRHAWGHYVWVLVTKSIVRGEDGNPLHVVT